jgi:putative PIN family toxin of toxin-antitoxin system
MIKAFIDTNIIIDFFLGREPHYQDAETIFKKIGDKKIDGYISASAITDIFYLLQKQRGSVNAVNCLIKLIQIIEVLKVDKGTIENALKLGCRDFEDAVQAQVAIESRLDIIITRNSKDYENLKTIKVLSPRDIER